MKVRKLNTGIQTLAQSERGLENTELAVCRFDYDDNVAIITVGGVDSQTEYVVEPSAGASVYENGDLLEGFEITDGVRLRDTQGTSAGTIQDLLSDWNTESNARLMLLRLNNGAEGHFEIGVEDYVVLPFSTASPVHFNIGDYIDLAMVLDTAQGKQFAKRYEVCEFPKPTLNISTGGYDYELRLDAYYMKWKNKIFRYIPTEVELGEMATGEASWSLTADLATHVEVVLRNLTSLGYTYGKTQAPFDYFIQDGYNDTAQLVTYDGINIIDALTAMAEAFNCEWWVTDNVINFGKCEQNDLVQVEIGVEAEQMSRTDSQGTFATRLYAFGAERNLQSNYRSTDDEVLVNGIVQRRLMLPESVPYVDAWKYESDGTRVYTTLYKVTSDGGRVYLDGYKVDANGDVENVGTSAFYDTDGDILIGGYKINVAKSSDGVVSLSRTYFTQDEYNALKAMTVEEVIEGIVQTDDIYPRTEDEVTAVSMYVLKFDRATEGDAGTVVYDDLQDEWKGKEFNPDDVQLGDTEYLQYYYRIRSAICDSFEDAYIMSGLTLSLAFTSGQLNGMEFEVMFLNPSYDGNKWFEIVANDTYGRTLPDDVLKPAVGNKYVLYNWQAIDTKTGEPTEQMQALIEDAEWELLEYAVAYLHDTMIDDGVYETEMNPAWVWDETMTEGMRNEVYPDRTFAVGQRILLVNDALFDVPRESRVVGFTVNIDIPYDHPTYKIGESVQYSRIGAVESKVNQIIYNGGTYNATGSGTRSTSGGSSIYLIKTNDTTAPSDTNAYSALRARGTFILKDQDDTTPYNLTVEKVLTMVDRAIAEDGVQFGREFITGLLGRGGLVDGSGNAEFDSVAIRKWLEVPEIRYNRTTVTTGLVWHTVGAGKIESVEIDKDADGNNSNTGIITLKLEDGEIGAIAENDLCMGVFHDFENINNNETENYDSRTGNFKFAGFGTVYFRVDEILDTSNNSRFRYVLRGTNERWTAQNHPRPYMSFACYANTNNTERQECTYETTNYLIALDNMNDWEYDGTNIYYIRGKLDGFSPNGTELQGNGVYLGNVYFYGTLQQIVNAPYYMDIDTEGDQFIAPNDTQPFRVTCTVYKGGIWDDCTEYVTKWTITREGSDSASDAVWNADHTDFAGYIELTYADLDTSHNTQSTLFRITAEGTDTRNAQTISLTRSLDVH